MDKATDESIETGTDELTTTAGWRNRSAPDAGADAALEAIVVRYRSGRDRCTLVPRDAPPEAMLTAWLSADLETVVALEDVR